MVSNPTQPTGRFCPHVAPTQRSTRGPFPKWMARQSNCSQVPSLLGLAPCPLSMRLTPQPRQCEPSGSTPSSVSIRSTKSTSSKPTLRVLISLPCELFHGKPITPGRSCVNLRIERRPPWATARAILLIFLPTRVMQFLSLSGTPSSSTVADTVGAASSVIRPRSIPAVGGTSSRWIRNYSARWSVRVGSLCAAYTLVGWLIDCDARVRECPLCTCYSSAPVTSAARRWPSGLRRPKLNAFGFRTSPCPAPELKQ